MNRFSGFILTALLLTGVAQSVYSQVIFGSEIFIRDHVVNYQSTRVGLVVNHVSMVGSRHLADTLISLGVPVTVFFAPEHGIRGAAAAGEIIRDGRDVKTGLPVVSLYGKKKMPDSTDMSLVDAILFDLQDVGARPYTYSSTMAYVMEACAKWNKKFIVLDRPNPLGGIYVNGWVLEDSLRSFVGRFPIPLAHGVTLGELALMIKGEKWVPGLENLNLEVIRVEKWTRKQNWLEIGRPWVAPSPNLADLNAVFAYPGTVLFEGTNLSEGRGTPAPFLLIGAPGMRVDYKKLNAALRNYGFSAKADTATPRTIPGRAWQPKWEGQKCAMIRLDPMRDKYMDPVGTGLILLRHVLKLNPNIKTNDFLLKLAGSADIQNLLSKNTTPEKAWSAGLSSYITIRTKYLLYE
jgi:uncharacterized protein YbbC (DUF1343 family)